MSAQPPAGPPRLAAAPVRRSRFAPASLALNLLARGLLPCTCTRLRNRAEPANGRTLPLAPADAPVQFRPDRLVPLLSFSFRARRATSIAASPSVASAAPRRALDVVEPWKEALDAMLLAEKLLPNPPLLLLYSLAHASAARTSTPCSSRLPPEQSSPRPSAPCYSSWRTALARPRRYSVRLLLPDPHLGLARPHLHRRLEDLTHGAHRPAARRRSLARACAAPAHARAACALGPRRASAARAPPRRARCSTRACVPAHSRRPLGEGSPRAPPARPAPSPPAPPPGAAPREGGRGKLPDRAAAGGGETKDAKEKKNRGEGEKGFPKDLCANLENCRDLSIK
jgi:hypothetical protein